MSTAESDNKGGRGKKAKGPGTRRPATFSSYLGSSWKTSGAMYRRLPVLPVIR
jgi:hypothetical protein